MGSRMKKKSIAAFIALHSMVALYSVCGIFSKKAAQYSFMSIRFCVFYALMIMILFIYAIGWQQVIKHIELTAAYSAKAAAVIWGVLWGMLFFHEKLTLLRVIGIVLVSAGLIIYFSKGSSVEEESS